MNIDHVHFYVEDAKVWRDWFMHTLGFQSFGGETSQHIYSEVVGMGSICFVLSSARTEDSPVAEYLQRHPPGIVDLAFRVTDLEAVLQRAIAQGMPLLQPLQAGGYNQNGLRWAQVAGWGELKHTLIEGSGFAALLPLRSPPEAERLAEHRLAEPWIADRPTSAVVNSDSIGETFIGIDHVVLNVGVGDLEPAVRWYENTLGFQRQQAFMIQTEYSALGSQVMKHPDGTVQMPINQPASPSSQIQEFLDVNRGAGVQHIALRTLDVVKTIAQLRQRGLPFLQVPTTYYEQLRQRPGFQLTESAWQAIARQEVLVDWQADRPEAMLLQAFTHPIFAQPTFFLELIERQVYQFEQEYRQVQGFGEGNFRALFEAIEREQMKRGSLF